MGPLQGVRVLDLTRALAGPYCASLLGDMGAEVVKIETSIAGERARRLEPSAGGQSLYCMAVNRNKYGAVIDLKKPEGIALLHELVAQADVLVENFRPGVMEAMNCGWDKLAAINPRLIFARISGFGQEGPYARRAGLDMAAQAMSGIMDMTGAPDGPPTMAGVFICDYATGLYAALGVTAALMARTRTGRGQVVAANLLDSALSMLHSAIPDMLLNGNSAGRLGNRDRYTAPTNTFRTADGDWVMLLAGNDVMFPRLARVVGKPELIDDPRFRTFKERVRHLAETEAIAADWIAARGTDEVIQTMAHAGVPCAKCSTIAEVVCNEQIRHREQIVEIVQPTGLKVPLAGVAVRLSDTPLTIRGGLPNAGQHTGEVLKSWLGYDSTQRQHLKQRGIIDGEA